MKKLFISSRHRIEGTSSDFAVELPDTLEFPDNHACWVTSVSFPHSWYPVNGNNRVLYLLERNPASPGTVYRRGFLLSEGNYTLETLATAIQAGLNATANVGANFTVTVSAETLVVASPDTEFRLPSLQELTNAQWKRQSWDTATFANGVVLQYSASEPKALNDLLGLPLESSWTQSLQTGIVDLYSNHTLYLHSSLGNYSTLDTAGRRGIMAVIPVTTAYGFTQTHVHSGLGEDFVDVSLLKARNLRFSLRNVHGQPVPLRGGHVSIELVFGPSGNYS